MKKAWMIAALALILLGIGVFVAALAVNDWDFSRLGTGSYETATAEITEEFDSIAISVDTADVSIRRSEDGQCRLVTRAERDTEHTATVKDGVLCIEFSDERSFLRRLLQFSFGSPSVTLYLPDDAYAALTVETATGDTDIPRGFSFGSIEAKGSTGDFSSGASVSGLLKVTLSTGRATVTGCSVGALQLETSTGSIRLSEVACSGAVSIQVNTGDIELSDVAALTLTASADTGDVALRRVRIGGQLSVTTDTGEVSLTSSDAETVHIRTTTGDVTGSFLSDKIVYASSDTGKVDVPHLTSGGICEITTDTGRIRITIE